MNKRRDFVKWFSERLLALSLLSSPLGSFLRIARANNRKKLIPKDIGRTDLRNWNPKGLDASNLNITPLKDFGTMGLEDYSANLDKWRLIVDGHVGKALSLPYEEVTN